MLSSVLCAGFILDRIGSTIRNALLLCAGSMLVGSALVALAFGLAGRLWQFIPLFGAGQFAWFAMQARPFRLPVCKRLQEFQMFFGVLPVRRCQLSLWGGTRLYQEKHAHSQDANGCSDGGQRCSDSSMPANEVMRQ